MGRKSQFLDTDYLIITTVSHWNLSPNGQVSKSFLPKLRRLVAKEIANRPFNIFDFSDFIRR